MSSSKSKKQVNPQVETENTNPKPKKQHREKYSFLKPYLEEDEFDEAGGGSKSNNKKQNDDQPCPDPESDPELERERSSSLPARCKTYDNTEEDNGTGGGINYREAPDFEQITNYDEYLDHYVTWQDLYYFESDDIARIITTLGFRVPELLNRNQFNEVMEGIRAKRLEKRRDDIHIAWEVKTQIKCPLMQALADREVPNRNRHLACIIYIRTINLRNEEVSAWIDFRVRLKVDDQLWYDYFSGKRKLIPRPTDLCYYNWSSFQVRFNSSENYLVTTEINDGLQFMNKADRKLITVNPKGSAGDNTNLIHIRSPNYMHAMIYDHSLRIKA